MTKGLVFSGQLLLDLAARGVLREQAYRWVQQYSMRAWESGESFRALIQEDPEISKILTIKDLDHSFSLDRQLRHVDRIFERLFGLES
jgi:adenylosuccinate lyase